MIRNYFRKLIVLLSFFYKNKNEKNIKKEKIVLTKLNKFYKLNN